nr:hypothetical protein [Pseudomonas sp. S32]
MAFKSPDRVSRSTTGFRGALNNHILPTIGRIPVGEIKVSHITEIISIMRRARTWP